MEDKEKQSAVAAPASSTGKKPFYGWVVVVACGLVYLLLGSFALNPPSCSSSAASCSPSSAARAPSPTS